MSTFRSGPFLNIFAPPFISGERLQFSHYLRFYVAFFLYYLGLPFALLLHLFSLYHIRFYAADVAILVFSPSDLFSRFRLAVHFILRCENPDAAWLQASNYTGMRYPGQRPFIGEKVTIQGGQFAKYQSLLHCMLDLMIRLTPVPVDLRSEDDRVLATWLVRNYQGYSGSLDNVPASQRSCYTEVAAGRQTLASFNLPSFPVSVLALSLGFFLWWALLDRRGFERATGVRLGRLRNTLRSLPLVGRYF
jgi:hypothetical protein